MTQYSAVFQRSQTMLGITKMKFFLIIFACLFLNPGAAVTRNLILVLDTTWSMESEVQFLKRNIRNTLNDVNIENYVLITFAEPGVSTEYSTRSVTDFVRKLNSITARGGRDCPEDSLAALQQAVQGYGKDSAIYLFTDAFANSNEAAVNYIKNSCKKMNARVNIFLSGRCVPVEGKPQGEVDVFGELAHECSGVFLRVGSTDNDYRQVLNFMKEIITGDWSVAKSIVSLSGAASTTESTSGEFLAAVTGNGPQLQIQDSNLNNIDARRIVDSPNSKVVKLTGLEAGDYSFHVSDNTVAALVVYKKKEFPFVLGFATYRPRSMRETSARPVTGWQNYLLVKLPPNMNVALQYADVKHLNSPKDSRVSLTQLAEGLYLSTTFLVSGIIKITITGRDLDKYEDISEISNNIEPQRSDQDPEYRSPTLEILDDSILVEDGGSTMFVAKVEGYPVPTITWTNSRGVKVNSEVRVLDLPYVHISYLTINNIRGNDTYTCKAVNIKGDGEDSRDVYVKRTHYFEEKILPEDKTIDYGKSDKLYCEVTAVPEGTTKWLFKNKDVDTFQVSSIDNSLTISDMSLENVGTYVCEVKNRFETKTYSAYVSIGGLEKPQIDRNTPTTVYWKLGDKSDLQCRTKKGLPEPQISWQYREEKSYIFSNTLPSWVYQSGGKLEFSTVTSDHKGTYKCTATNAEGSDSMEIVVKIQEPPKINNKRDREVMRIKQGSNLVLPCEVVADPAPRVWWTKSDGLYTDGVSVASNDGRITVDRLNTLRLNDAASSDAGFYSCNVQNEIGSDKNTVQVEVLVRPYIEVPSPRKLTVKFYEDVVLQCRVLYGYPAPTVYWRFQPEEDGVAEKLYTGTDLHLSKVDSDSQGTYTCFAVNELGPDHVKINLYVI